MNNNGAGGHMLKAAVRTQLVVIKLRERLRGELGAEAVQVALITAALVALALLLITALRNRTQPAIDEINGLATLP